MLRRLFVLLLLWTAPAAHAGARAPLTVFVSIPPQKFFVEAVGGERVDVHVMLRPGKAPETYEPSPRQIAALATADLYFLIGVPFEHNWLEGMLAQNASLAVVDLAAEAPPVGASHGHGPHDHGDPHVWLDVAYARVMARQVAGALAVADPAGAPLFESRLRALLLEMDRLERDLDELLASPRIRHFIIAHAALDRLTRAHGLVQVALEEGGRSAGPRRIVEMVELARAEGIGTVFVQRQHDTVAAHVLADELGADVVYIDPLAENYLDNMRTLARLVARATR
jgi:zinc transport system substrate-binding protein